MKGLTMCGYRCDLCKAFAPNIKNKDERELLSDMWMKYYELNIPADRIYCDGCRCFREDAKRIDMNCPVRKCVIEKGIGHCGDCIDFPCIIFEERRGLSLKEAREKLGDIFCEDEFSSCLQAYDNMTRLKEYKKNK